MEITLFLKPHLLNDRPDRKGGFSQEKPGLFQADFQQLMLKGDFGMFFEPGGEIGWMVVKGFCR